MKAGIINIWVFLSEAWVQNLVLDYPGVNMWYYDFRDPSHLLHASLYKIPSHVLPHHRYTNQSWPSLTWHLCIGASSCDSASQCMLPRSWRRHDMVTYSLLLVCYWYGGFQVQQPIMQVDSLLRTLKKLASRLYFTVIIRTAIVNIFVV